MTVKIAWKRRDFLRNHKIVAIRATYGNGDTTVAVYTGLKIVYGATHSIGSVAGKPITQCVVTGGTVTLTATDPQADAYVDIIAIGI